MNETPNFRDIERSTYSEMIEGRNVHDNLKNLSVPELKELVDNDRLHYDILAFNLTGDGNIGGIVRSAIIHGAGKVIVFGRRTYDKRSSVGADNYIEVERVAGFIENTIQFDEEKLSEIIEGGNYYPVFLEQGGVPLQHYDWSPEPGKKLLLVIGNETNGIPDKIIENYKNVSDIVSIPQRGVIRSLNVANAMNIACWDLRCKRGWI